MGPRLDARMPAAARTSTGAAATSASAARTTSSRRLTMASRAADGHEDLRGLKTVLIAPGARTMPQGFKGAGVGIGPHLALVACHGGDLVLQRGADVHPGVGDKAAGIAPLGAAGGVEGVDRFD